MIAGYARDSLKIVQGPRELALEITRLLAARAQYHPQARPKLEALFSRGQAYALLEVLDKQRLTELLGSRAITILGGSAPSSFAEKIGRAVSGSRARSMALEALAARVTELFGEEGIPMLPLKGSFLARRLYGDAGMRFVNDLDLLVSPSQIQHASALIGQLGYDADDPPWLDGLPPLHYVFRDPNGRLPRIELHWRIHWYEDEFSAALLERSTSGDGGLREPQLADELAALLLYYARDGFYGLRTAADIATWWDTSESRAEAIPVLDRHWNEYPGLRRAFSAAALAAQTTVGVPAASIVPRSSSADLRPRLAVRLACWDQEGEHDRLVANMRVVDGLLSPPGGLAAFVRRFMLLDRREIAIMYDSSSATGTRMWQAFHVLKVGARYLLTLLGAVVPRRRRDLDTT